MMKESEELRSVVFNAIKQHGCDIDYDSIALIPQSDMSTKIVAISKNPTQKWELKLGETSEGDLIVGEFESINIQKGMNKLRDKRGERQTKALANICTEDE